MKTNNEIITSYKGFDKDLKCRGFQYEVGKEYVMDEPISICNKGFHACESPLEVFDYYDMLDSRFCRVEQCGEIQRDNNTTKICSSKIKLKAELKLSDMINIGVEWLKEITDPKKINTDYKYEDGSSGYNAKIGSSGYNAKIGSSGYNAKIGSSGDCAKIGSSGDDAKIGSSGDYAKIGSSGYNAKIGSSGDYAKIGSSGDDAKIGSSGYNAKIGSSGYNAKIGSSGYNAKIGSSGDYAKINSTGYDSVIMCAGLNSKAKAKKGSWITLAEWIYSDTIKRYVPVCVKTEHVDGERIKEDTWYELVNGEFIERK